MKRSFECLIAELCAPTLARIKVAGLFRYVPAEGEDVYAKAAYWDSTLSVRGVSVRILKQCCRTGAVLVLVFRPTQLEKILSFPEIRNFLHGNGYTDFEPEAALTRLSSRLCLEQDFPHEIGIFLGYPLSDVTGFIENHGKNFTYCGYWKTYGDPAEAQSRFARYKKCEQIYRRLFDNGTPILRLTVAA